MWKFLLFIAVVIVWPGSARACVHGVCDTCTCDPGWTGSTCNQDPIGRRSGLPFECSSTSCPDGMYCTPEGVASFSCKPE
ncbi:Hypp7539 [Branchiostoma lanceolatum]|uniref:Hypp7539 protein n=1 Tax=Branchiostoma lanceolatum TaxID=7740 RepID=A0A8J9Z219_BRALA|nr:Hypp7539 [Branchiostoma lanceolatum]